MTAENESIEMRSPFRLRFSLLALFIFVTLVCCLLAWLVQRKQVVATALFRVSSRRPSLLGDDAPQRGDENEFEVLKKTQLATITSYFVLSAAVRKPGIATLRTFWGKTPEDWIQQHLEVDFPNDAEILRISLSGTEEQAQDIARIVDAVASAYSDEVVYKDRARQAASKDLLSKSLEGLNRKIMDKSATMLAISKESGRHEGAAATAFRELVLGELERVDVELLRLENEQLKRKGGDEEVDSQVYETRIAQLRERQTRLVEQLARETEPSVELNALKAEIALLQQTANELAIKLQKLAIDQNAPPRIELIQRAVVSSAD